MSIHRLCWLSCSVLALGCSDEVSTTLTGRIVDVNVEIQRDQVDEVVGSFVLELDRGADGGDPSEVMLTWATPHVCYERAGTIMPHARYTTNDTLPAEVSAGNQTRVTYHMTGEVTQVPSGWSVWCELSEPIHTGPRDSPACDGAGGGFVGFAMEANYVDAASDVDRYGATASLFSETVAIPLAEDTTAPPPVEAPVTWTVPIVTNERDVITSVAMNASGNVLAVVETASDEEDAPRLIGLQSGTEIFSRDLPPTDGDDPPPQVVTDGATIVAGTFRGGTTVVGTALASSERGIFIASLDAAGDALWVRDLGDTDMTFQSVAVDEAGMTAVSGFAWVPADVDGVTIETGAFVLTLDATGMAVAAASLPNAPEVMVASTAGFLVFGAFDATGLVVGDAFTPRDLLAVRDIAAVASDGAGGAVIAGTDGFGFHVGWIERVDATGASLWQRLTGTSEFLGEGIHTTGIAVSGNRIVATGYMVVDSDLGTGLLDAGGPKLFGAAQLDAGTTAFVLELDLADGTTSNSEIAACVDRSHSVDERPSGDWLVAAHRAIPDAFAWSGSFRHLAIGEGWDSSDLDAFASRLDY